jgi:hypothetical protein
LSHTCRSDLLGGVVLDKHQTLLLLGRQLLHKSGEKGRRDVADGAPLDKAQEGLLAIRAQQPIAAERFGIRVVLGEGLLDELQWALLGPGMQWRMGQPTPPGLIDNAQHSVQMLVGQVHQGSRGAFVGHTGDRDWCSRTWPAASSLPGA